MVQMHKLMCKENFLDVTCTSCQDGSLLDVFFADIRRALCKEVQWYIFKIGKCYMF